MKMNNLNKSTLRYGLPFLSFVILGSFLLREFAAIRYEVYSHKKRYGLNSGQNERKLELQPLSDSGVPDKIVNEENEIESLMKLGSNDDWKNIRGPRPWEDNSEFNSMIDSLKEKNKNK